MHQGRFSKEESLGFISSFSDSSEGAALEKYKSQLAQESQRYFEDLVKLMQDASCKGSHIRCLVCLQDIDLALIKLHTEPCEKVKKSEETLADLEIGIEEIVGSRHQKQEETRD